MRVKNFPILRLNIVSLLNFVDNIIEPSISHIHE